MPEKRRMRFAQVYELDPETNEILHKGKQLKLPLKPAKVLSILASSPGELVTREALRESLWGADTFVDFEHGLNFCIRKIRAALHDDAKAPRFIETLPKRGYRFIAPVHTASLATAKAADASAGNSEAENILANEHYVKGRLSLARHDKGTLDEAYQEFCSALDLKPDYAMAHSGLGATMALRMLNRRGHAELETALRHLQRAVELDEELSDPYPWLCFVFLRQGKTALAVQAGLRAVELQPDMPQAHYFLGLAYFLTCEEGSDAYDLALGQLLEAARVGPHWHPTWFVLAYTALLLGDYPSAEAYSNRLSQSSNQPGMPFVGGEIVLASVRLRQGEGGVARQILKEFCDRMQISDHMYRDAMTAIAACVLGDVEIRDGNIDMALAAYRRAWQTLQEHTRIVAHRRISVRAQTGLAMAYWCLGEHDRAGRLLDKAMSMLPECVSVSGAAAAASLPELYLSLAAAMHLTGERDSALDMIEQAYAVGWRDAAGLQRDPLLDGLQSDDRFRECVARIGVANVTVADKAMAANARQA